MSHYNFIDSCKQVIYKKGFRLHYFTQFKLIFKILSRKRIILNLIYSLLAILTVLWMSEVANSLSISSKVPQNDFNGDGKSDVLWRHATNGVNRIWDMSGTTVLSDPVINVDPNLNWKVVGTGDFDGDGKADVLWRNAINGRNRLWLMNNATIKSQSPLVTANDINWKVVGTGSNYSDSSF